MTTIISSSTVNNIASVLDRIGCTRTYFGDENHPQSSSDFLETGQASWALKVLDKIIIIFAHVDYNIL